MTTESGELVIYQRLFAEKYAEVLQLLEELPGEALLWKPFEHSPWQGESNTLGLIVAHATH